MTAFDMLTHQELVDLIRLHRTDPSYWREDGGVKSDTAKLLMEYNRRRQDNTIEGEEPLKPDFIGYDTAMEHNVSDRNQIPWGKLMEFFEGTIPWNPDARIGEAYDREWQDLNRSEDAFDTAWSLIKIDEAQDPQDYLTSLIEQEKLGEWRGLNDIGRIFSSPGGRYTDVILEQILDPSNQYSLTDAKTPTVYRAEPIEDAERFGVAPDEFRYGRYFSPQRLTAEQYAQYQGGRGILSGRGRGRSQVHEYEMPVGFDDDSVLNVPVIESYDGLQGTDFDIESPEVNRVASMNNMTPSEAKDALQMWHSVYMGAAPMPTKEGIEDRVGPLRDAGYDYITWPEFASAHYYPPTAASAFGSIDWGAPHEAKYNRKEVDEWWKPARDEIMEQLGIPRRYDKAMGKHTTFPQWASWHIGDEDSAPRYVSNQGIPHDLGYKYQKVDYDNFNNAADIAEHALGLRGKRWEKR